MDSDTFEIIIHLVSALIAGGIIGLERSFHGRPAGFRTHAIVCMASSMLMLVTLYQWEWLPQIYIENIRSDPTRMAQGILTGIGFLGAGVIFKEGPTVRGLTTAASVWITSGIGILIGIGFYIPAILATIFTLCILTLFRWIEEILPSHYFAHFTVKFDQNKILPEYELVSFLRNSGFTTANMSYRLSDDKLTFEYKMIIRTANQKNLAKLAVDLRTQIEGMASFHISPSSD
jgi:putative Mg2+ transporter-C (MgtC) family protein